MKKCLKCLGLYKSGPDKSQNETHGDPEENVKANVEIINLETEESEVQPAVRTQPLHKTTSAVAASHFRTNTKGEPELKWNKKMVINPIRMDIVEEYDQDKFIEQKIEHREKQNQEHSK